MIHLLVHFPDILSVIIQNENKDILPPTEAPLAVNIGMVMLVATSTVFSVVLVMDVVTNMQHITQ